MLLRFDWSRFGRLKSSIVFPSMQVIALLVQVYHAAPVWVRAVTFAKVVEALGLCMEVSQISKKGRLTELITHGFEPRTFAV